MCLDNLYMQEWIASGNARVVSAEIAREFGEYLNALEWDSSGTRLNWSRINSVTVDVSEADDVQLIDWLSQTTISVEEDLVFWFSPDESAVSCKASFGIMNVDVAFWKAPGPRYMFAASWGGDVVQPRFEALIEYDGVNTLRATRKLI